MESSRTSLASRTSSRTHFEVLGLGLEGQVLGLEVLSSRKLPCPRLEDSTIFWTLKILLENVRNFAENLLRPFSCFSVGDCLKKFLKDLFFFGDRLKNFKTLFGDHQKIFFWYLFFVFVFLKHLHLCPRSWALASSSPVLGHERVHTRKSCPWPRIFCVHCLRLFFCVLGLELCALDSTSACLEAGMAVHYKMYIVQLHTVPEMKTGLVLDTVPVDQPVGLPVGWRFFNRQVKLVETSVKIFFLGTKRHLSSNRNTHIYFIVNRNFYKKTVPTNHTFWKHLLNGF